MEIYKLGKKNGTIEANHFFIYGFTFFLLVVSCLSFYIGLFSSEKPKLPLLLGVITFGSVFFMINKKKKNRIDIYENGIEVDGILTQKGTFLFEDMGRVEKVEKKSGFLKMIAGFEYFNVTLYGRDGGLLTGFSSLFYKGLGEKWATVERKIPHRH